ncbi:hypothetical protein BXZ70DRAFT_1011336 [Cristinia sonorae]|uniref:Uncharacterized protein n=1 Tax=Cristinia sonorae TaxID=1940300 RepID=A0A8K0UGK4_9AGAR|nr:hypothetical protein BXZ70DRAFT_1011336 [Cristinia sonorae]
MGQPRWTTTEELNWLLGSLPLYIAYSQLPPKKRDPAFWKRTYASFFALFPSPEPTEKEREAAGENEEVARQLAIKRRRSQVYYWLHNHSRGSTSGNNTKGLLNLTSRTRKKQLGQTYLALYKTELKPILKKAYRKYVKSRKSGVKTLPQVAFSNRWAKQRYEAESDEVKELVKQIVDGDLDPEDLEDDEDDEESKRLRRLRKRQSAVDKLVPTLNHVVLEIEKLTGFKTSIFCAGINPTKAGLTTFSLHHGTSLKKGLTWAESYNDFDNEVHGEYRQWARTAFSQAECDHWSFLPGDDVVGPDPVAEEEEEDDDDDDEDDNDDDEDDNDDDQLAHGTNANKRVSSSSRPGPSKRRRTDGSAGAQQPAHRQAAAHAASAPSGRPSEPSAAPPKKNPPGARTVPVPSSAFAVGSTTGGAAGSGQRSVPSRKGRPPGIRTTSMPSGVSAASSGSDAASESVRKGRPPGIRTTSMPSGVSAASSGSDAASESVRKGRPPGIRTNTMLPGTSPFGPTTGGAVPSGRPSGPFKKGRPPGVRVASAPSGTSAAGPGTGGASEPLNKGKPPGVRAVSAPTPQTPHAGPSDKRAVSIAPPTVATAVENQRTQTTVPLKRRLALALPTINEDDNEEPPPKKIRSHDDSTATLILGTALGRGVTKRRMQFNGIYIKPRERHPRHISAEPIAKIDKGKGRATEPQSPYAMPPPPSQYRPWEQRLELSSPLRSSPLPPPPPRRLAAPVGPRPQLTGPSSRRDPNSRLMTPAPTQPDNTSRRTQVNSSGLPDWLVKALAYLEDVVLWKEWLELIKTWVQFERRMGLNSNDRISTAGRPRELSQRDSRHYKTSKLSVASLPAFVSGWRIWYIQLQPEWRGRTWPLSRCSLDDDESSWVPLQQAGPCGLFLVVLGLAWWIQALPDANVRDQEVMDAIADLLWVFRCTPSRDI